jgi:hypothetical protein
MASHCAPHCAPQPGAQPPPNAPIPAPPRAALSLRDWLLVDGCWLPGIGRANLLLRDWLPVADSWFLVPDSRAERPHNMYAQTGPQQRLRLIFSFPMLDFTKFYDNYARQKTLAFWVA